MGDEGWQMQRTRKNRRQQARHSQPAAGSVGGGRAGNGVHRPLPDWLRRNDPTPPWRSGGMAGTKKSGNAGEGRPWPFPEGAPKPKRVGDKVPCCNPRCPGVGGRQSFKWDYAVARGQNGSHCVACNMAWKKSWNVHYTVSPLPAPPLQELPAWRCAVGRL